jgi:hypothetical protein
MGCNTSKETAKAKAPPRGPHLDQVSKSDQDIIAFRPPEINVKAKHPSTGVHLVQVHPNPLGPKTKTDIDIIAIHGLDTNSPDTWAFKRDNQPPSNWLKDKAMLPSKVGESRIFTCDWPAEMFESTDLAEKEIEEVARRLIDAIKRRDPPNNDDRPILFIASCFGGIILVKALLDIIDNDPIRSSTRGVIFLATPFRGTTYAGIANWAQPGLTVYAKFQGKRLTQQLALLAGPTFKMNELIRSFGRLRRANGYHVFTFYEKGTTDLVPIPGLSKSQVVSMLPIKGLPITVLR